MNARLALFQHFIDYAGLFPPAELAMQPAVEEYGALRSAQAGWMLGRFIVPGSRLRELGEMIDEQGATPDASVAPYGVSVIINAEMNPPTWLNAAASLTQSVAAVREAGGPLQIEIIEAPVPAPAAARDTFDSAIGQFGMLAHNAGLRDLDAFIELPRTPSWGTLLPGAMGALQRAGFGAKIRCGGVVQDAFPSSEEIAAFISAATENGVPFKATAGLHHPVRRRDPGTGLYMHGFLNLLAAAIFARGGAATPELTAMLDDEDPAAFTISDDSFAYRTRTATTAEIQAARKRFVSYGSCSFEEPVNDLTAMGILQSAGAPA